MRLDISSKEIKKKQSDFKKEFIKSFNNKLDELHETAVGRTTVEVEYSRTAIIAQQIYANLAGNAVQAIPFVGPFAATFLTNVPIQIYEHYEKKKIRQKVADGNDYYAAIGDSLVASIIAETAHEIARIFEYQIAAMKASTEIHRIAEVAVNKIFDYASSNGGVSFSRNSLINSLIIDSDRNPLKMEKALYKIIDGAKVVQSIYLEGFNVEDLLSDDNAIETILNKNWDIGKIFTKPGLRIEKSDGSYEFKFKPGTKIQDLEYGFRSRAFDWQENTNSYSESEIDKDYLIDVSVVEDAKRNKKSSILSYLTKKSQSKVFPEEFNHKAYHPLMRIVSKQDVENYNKYLDESRTKGSKANFIIFLKETYNFAVNQDVIPVFRQYGFSQGENLNFSDLSSSDMVRINFKDSTIENSLFQNTNMMLANINSCTFQDSYLNNADMRWGKLTAVNMKGNTILTQTLLEYSIIDENTDFTDNPTFGSASTGNAVIMTDKLFSTLLKRMQTAEESNAKLEQKLQELLEREAKQNSEYERVKLINKANSLPLFYNVRDEVDDFTGREDVLARLKESYKKPELKTLCSVVAGEGGMGKTQTVLKYVSMFKNDYAYFEGNERVFWVAAENKETISVSFREFAQKLKLDIEKKSDAEILKLVQHKLSELHQTLFIFDNVIDKKLIEKYIPKSVSAQHHVMITTRNTENWPSIFYLEKLEPFSEKEAYLYARNAKPFAEDAEILELINEFNNQPLGLSQAVGFIVDNDLEISEYIEYYRGYKASKENIITEKTEEYNYKQIELVVNSNNAASRKPALLNEKARSIKFTDLELLQLEKEKLISQDPLVTSFSISYDSIKASFPKALEIINLLGYTYADKIPALIFKDIFEENEKELLKALLLLESGNIITVKTIESERYIYIHRKRQDIIRANLKENQLELENLLKLADALLQKGEKSDELAILNTNAKLLEHCISLSENYKNFVGYVEITNETRKILDFKIAESLRIVFLFYYVTAKYDESKKIAEQAIEIITAYNKENNLYGACMDNIAGVYYAQGDYVKALEMYQDCLRIKEATFGHEHPEVATTIGCIAGVYRAQGDYAKALEMYQDCLRIKEATFGHEHPEVATTIGCIASVYDAQGDYAKALEMYQDCLRIQEATFGHEHPKVATTIG
eukprot:CAMPEP_0196767670 /NCGR_PEP_ID=MMETSP1095-20130614/41835_1 /TAXON_ID=96789 ORGANISM="Chromulina nebulosa, Strain UTEXLB2642" /NCGR_SAMPLE_ID=MMETSP1095 /ASSEMBLY_ACC=CAM_ASM_000446 /LENGTH=1159 /DNA_ID=CAMNT_0042136189 /DNA_START=59 /DNA_END=3534 /DNA_ORIENTATION=+